MNNATSIVELAFHCYLRKSVARGYTVEVNG